MFQKNGGETDKTMKERKWDRDEVVVLVAAYFKTKPLSNEDSLPLFEKLSDFLRLREKRLVGQPVSETFRNIPGIRMQFWNIKCLDPDTKHEKMNGSRLQKRVVEEYLKSPETILDEAKAIYEKYSPNEPTLKIHGLYQDVNGKYYLVEDIAMHTMTTEECVVYRCLHKGNHLLVTPKSTFLEEMTPMNIQPPITPSVRSEETGIPVEQKP